MSEQKVNSFKDIFGKEAFFNRGEPLAFGLPEYRGSINISYDECVEIRSALEKGTAREKSAHISAGWATGELDKAINKFLGLPVNYPVAEREKIKIYNADGWTGHRP